MKYIGQYADLFLGVGLVCMLIIVGCGKKPVNVSGPPPTVAVPDVDIDPVKKDVNQAHASAVGARDNLDKALAKPGPESLPLVSTARSQTGETVAHLEQAQNIDIPKLQAERDAAKAAVKTNQDACNKAVADKDGAIAELTEKIKKLEDEGLQRFKFWLYLVGGICMAGGIASGVLAMFYGFFAGRLLAIVGTPLGIILIWIASRLTAIMAGLDWAAAIGLVLLGIVAAWHYFHHVPVVAQPLLPLDVKPTENV